jgi:AraC-like DNA-binding protein
MKYSKYYPIAPLKDLIEHYLFINLNADYLSQKEMIFVPNGSPALVIHLANSMVLSKDTLQIKLPNVFVIGLINSKVNLNPLGNLNSILILFKPNAFFHLFDISMCDLNEAFYTDATNFLKCTTVNNLHNRLMSAKNDSEKITIIENYFLSIISHKKISFDLTDTIIQRILKENGCVKVNDLIKYYNVAERSLRRNMTLKTGYSPKEFTRIIRFKFLMQNFQNLPIHKWTDIIAYSDFYDQSHFIKEIKKFTGNSPKRLSQLDPVMLRILNGTIT